MLPRMEYKASGILFTLGKLCSVSISPVADLHVLGLAEQGALLSEFSWDPVWPWMILICNEFCNELCVWTCLSSSLTPARDALHAGVVLRLEKYSRGNWNQSEINFL